MRPARDRRIGIQAALLAAALFGTSTPFAKLLLRAAPAQLVAGLLYLGSGIGLTLVWLYRRSRGVRPEAPIRQGDLPWLASAIVAGGLAGPLLLMIGLARTQAAAASLLLNLEAVFTAILAWFVFRENVDRRIAAGMLAIVAGSAVLTWERGVSLQGLSGSLLVAGACLAWGIDNNLTQKISGGDPVQIAALKGLVAGCANTVIASALGVSWPTPSHIGGALLLGFVSYGVSLALYVLALRHLGTARTGAYFSVAPFAGALASLMVFREPPTAGLLLGAGLMAVGVWLHITERHEHAHVHERLEHEHLHVHDAHHLHEHRPGDPSGEPHSHRHRHEPLVHTHPHYPDLHHRHPHE
ncbi:MAG: EamA family transporter [Gemmatimonadetes bacterium]|nr:EamA family transporter [Gemmatimonadota bacterium]